MRVGKNIIMVRPGAPCFVVGGNLCPWFEIGVKDQTPYYLKAEIVGEQGSPEFLFNGVLFTPGGSDAGTIIDSFPKAPAPAGWITVPRMDRQGYELRDVDGKSTLFGFEVDNNVCHVTVNIFDASGNIIARSSKDDLELLGCPVNICNFIVVR